MLVRWLITALLALALPVQGLAAAAKWHCLAMGQHQLAHATVSAPAHAEHPGCPHAAAVGDGAIGNAGLAQAVDGEADLKSAPESDHRCSACAVCCIGLALPVLMSPPPVLASHEAVHPLGTALEVSFLPGGLERPPRTDLA